jgi:hypothetical protein
MLDFCTYQSGFQHTLRLRLPHPLPISMPQQAKERGMPFETLIPLIKPLFDGPRAVKNFFHKGNEESTMVAAEKVAAVA